MKFIVVKDFVDKKCFIGKMKETRPSFELKECALGRKPKAKMKNSIIVSEPLNGLLITEVIKV